MKIIRGNHPVPIWLRFPLPIYIEEALQQFEETAKTQAFAASLDVVDAAIHARLMPGAHWQGSGDALLREELTPGSVRYTMLDANVGELGTVTIRMLDQQRTLLQFDHSPMPDPRPRTAEEQRAIDALGLGIWQKELNLDEKIEAEQQLHHRWCQAVYAHHVLFFLEQFPREQMWAKREAPLEGESALSLSPSDEFDQIVFSATQRAEQNGLSRENPPTINSGPDQIFDWFVAYWLPTADTFAKFTRKYLPTEDPKEVDRRWSKYRRKYNLPTFTELKKMRGKET
jgi:hypothetical protein